VAERHNRPSYYISNRGELRGETRRAATRAEQAGAFRFSEIVARQAAPNSDALLTALAERMTATIPEQDGDVPAGYTYLGQFIDHDLTRDVTKTPLGTPTTAAALEQGRSPALDLDSLYGRGPEDPGSAHLYAADAASFRLGVSKGLPPIGAPLPATAFQDLDGFDLPRQGAAAAVPEEARRAVIADPRNDENLAVAQIHLSFLRFHNAMVQTLVERGVPGNQLFESARRRTVLHYQWMIRHDFLPRLIEPSILDDVFTHGRRMFEAASDGPATMPIEFSVAAYRLGHSMIREVYDWNAIFNDRDGALGTGSLVNLFRFSGTSGNLSPTKSGDPNTPSDLDNPIDGDFETLPSIWVADWTQLFDFKTDAGLPALAPANGGTLNLARRIDTRLADPLRTLPLGSFGARGNAPVDPLQLNLAFRNLLRGRMVGLASAQEVVAHMQGVGLEVIPLNAAQILGGGSGGVDLTDLPPSVRDEAVNATPLWFYILREAELNGGRLTGVGGRIVAETFHRAMAGSRDSLLRLPFWRPREGDGGANFTMTDILMEAFNPAEGQLRPMSPNAPKATLPKVKPEDRRAA